MNGWEVAHGKVISSFLGDINKETNNAVLKGGTALEYYGLDRFSEDIGLDIRKGTNLIDLVDKFCKKHGYQYRIGKDTETVKRCFVNYGNESRPLKIEASYRNMVIDRADTSIINGVCVYNIDRLAQMKANAYAARDKIRDLYDLTFICNNYYEKLSRQTVNLVRDAVGNKGLEQFDYLLMTQRDPLVDNDKLASDFLAMNDKLGLLYGQDEKENLTEATKNLLDNQNKSFSLKLVKDSTNKKTSLRPKPGNPADGNSGSAGGRGNE